MWILRSSPASPFGRKVKVAAAICGLTDRFRVETTDTMNPADPIRSQNPLGKIPALILDNGAVLFDSRVILEWLDHAVGGGVIIPPAPQRFTALTLQALADGIMDASILIVYEHRFRPAEHHHQRWLDHQADKVTRSLAALEEAPPTMDGGPHVGHIALACALGYRDFRFQGAWRAEHPRLVEWLDRFAAAVPAFEESRPPAAS